MDATRFLIVMADDYGIGPETSARHPGIGGARRRYRDRCDGQFALCLGRRSRLAQSGVAPELGWHPCLTMDRPVAKRSACRAWSVPMGDVAAGKFPEKADDRAIHAEDIESELTAQYERFVEWVGRPPTVVNVHQHVGLFARRRSCVKCWNAAPSALCTANYSSRDAARADSRSASQANGIVVPGSPPSPPPAPGGLPRSGLPCWYYGSAMGARPGVLSACCHECQAMWLSWAVIQAISTHSARPRRRRPARAPRGRISSAGGSLL